MRILHGSGQEINAEIVRRSKLVLQETYGVQFWAACGLVHANGLADTTRSQCKY